MTRDEIIKGLFSGYNCTEKDECFESGCKDCIDLMFRKYEQQIRADVIDECFKTIQNYFIEYCDNASNKECDLLCEVAKGIHERFEKLKEQK